MNSLNIFCVTYGSRTTEELTQSKHNCFSLSFCTVSSMYILRRGSLIGVVLLHVMIIFAGFKQDLRRKELPNVLEKSYDCLLKLHRQECSTISAAVNLKQRGNQFLNH